MAFGLRNVSDTDAGLAEMVRVCRPGGQVAVLEFSMPTPWPLRALYGCISAAWCRGGPALAQNRQGAYNYLPQSVGEFPQAEPWRRMAGRVRQVRLPRFTFGVATLYME